MHLSPFKHSWFKDCCGDALSTDTPHTTDLVLNCHSLNASSKSLRSARWCVGRYSSASCLGRWSSLVFHRGATQQFLWSVQLRPPLLLHNNKEAVPPVFFVLPSRICFLLRSTAALRPRTFYPKLDRRALSEPDDPYLYFFRFFKLAYQAPGWADKLVTGPWNTSDRTRWHPSIHFVWTLDQNLLWYLPFFRASPGLEPHLTNPTRPTENRQQRPVPYLRLTGLR